MPTVLVMGLIYDNILFFKFLSALKLPYSLFCRDMKLQ